MRRNVESFGRALGCLCDTSHQVQSYVIRFLKLDLLLQRNVAKQNVQAFKVPDQLQGHFLSIFGRVRSHSKIGQLASFAVLKDVPVYWRLRGS